MYYQRIQAALKEFGLNFGIAFQIIDDYQDILNEDAKQGSCTGQDAAVGDITLPLLILMDISSKAERCELKKIFENRIDQASLERIRTVFLNSKAVKMTFDAALSYVDRARGCLGCLENSDYKRSLNDLADFIVKIDSGR